MSTRGTPRHNHNCRWTQATPGRAFYCAHPADLSNAPRLAPRLRGRACAARVLLEHEQACLKNWRRTCSQLPWCPERGSAPSQVIPRSAAELGSFSGGTHAPGQHFGPRAGTQQQYTHRAKVVTLTQIFASRLSPQMIRLRDLRARPASSLVHTGPSSSRRGHPTGLHRHSLRRATHPRGSEGMRDVGGGSTS
jgi:hypothetical protein